MDGAQWQMGVHRRRGHAVAQKEVKREWNWGQSNKSRQITRNVPRPSIFKTMRPSMIMRKAMTKRIQPDIVIPAFLFTSHAVNGQAEIPEKSANQPFVSGSGPCVMMSTKPPITATIVHPQAANHPKT